MTPTGRLTGSTHELLKAFLEDLPGAPSRRWSSPLQGTLPQLSRWAEERPLLLTALMILRSLGQVIFINNPLSGLLLLLGLVLESPRMGLLSLVGIAAATLTARMIGATHHARINGIYGFNGALVGCAAAVFGKGGADIAHPGWIVVVAIAAALSAALLHGLGEWLFHRAALPPLTLPFCLSTWLMLVGVQVLGTPSLALPGIETPLAATSHPLDPATLLLQGIPRGFGQVFLCSDVPSGWLALAAVAVASPMAAALGLSGALVGGMTALVMGVEHQAVALGLFSFNALLTAMAIGGIFFPLNRRSLGIALLASTASTLILPPLNGLLGSVSLPVLTLPFIVSTLMAMLLIRRAVPSLIPVAFHSLLTPEEHRERYRVSRGLLAAFRRQLGAALPGGRRGCSRLDLADPDLRARLQSLFAELDRDGNGRLSVAELATGLMVRRPDGRAESASRRRFIELQRVLRAMDLNGDGAVDASEFGELMLRLRQLDQGHEQLMTYLLPVDADANNRLDPVELDRLLRSVGQSPLTPAEKDTLYRPTSPGMNWSEFVDRLLLT